MARLLQASAAYTMAHPETGQLVPVCVQHSAPDPIENLAPRQAPPLWPTIRSRAQR